MKRIITMQDISCVGRCSLTVALPIISSFGIEACPLPTALLSCHTAFKEFEYLDLTDEAMKIEKSLKRQNLTFDGIYTGYLGSIKQIDVAKELVADFKTDNTLVAVDPVMGDMGKLYSGIDREMPKKMRELIKSADIIMPNMTEAGFLLGLERGLTEDDETESSLRALTDSGCKTAIITGVNKGDETGAAAYNSENGEIIFVMRKRIPQIFHGTGDIFASVLFSLLINGHSLESALNGAVDFTVGAMNETLKDPDARWYGVNFESLLKDKK